jgi:hypothetical protein
LSPPIPGAAELQRLKYRETRGHFFRRRCGPRLAPRLLKRPEDFDIDGLRTDIEGNLPVARILKRTIAVLSPQGKLNGRFSSTQGSRLTSPSAVTMERRLS